MGGLVSRRLFNSNNFTSSAALAEVYALPSAIFVSYAATALCF